MVARGETSHILGTRKQQTGCVSDELCGLSKGSWKTLSSFVFLTKNSFSAGSAPRGAFAGKSHVDNWALLPEELESHWGK